MYTISVSCFNLPFLTLHPTRLFSPVYLARQPGYAPPGDLVVERAEKSCYFCKVNIVIQHTWNMKK